MAAVHAHEVRKLQRKPTTDSPEVVAMTVKITTDIVAIVGVASTYASHLVECEAKMVLKLIAALGRLDYTVVPCYGICTCTQYHKGSDGKCSCGNATIRLERAYMGCYDECNPHCKSECTFYDRSRPHTSDCPATQYTGILVTW